MRFTFAWKMKLAAAAIATLVLTVLHTLGADGDVRLSTWADFELVLKKPDTVDDQILKPHKATAIATKHVQVPEHSENPGWDFELTLWKHGIPGIKIVTQKMLKERGRIVNGALKLSYLEIDVRTYGQYLASQGVLLGDFLIITPKGARHRFPNIEEDTIDDRGTGVMAQYLWEYGDDPLAFPRMRFAQGRLEKASFGKRSKWLNQLLEPANIDSEQAGADQPATAPQLKAESKEKPKPESEVRSR